MEAAFFGTMRFPIMANLSWARAVTCLLLWGLLLTGSSAVAALPPVITVQPVDQIVPLGGTAFFLVEASSGTTLSYQWYFQGAAISGATSNAYTLNNAQFTNAGGYYAAVQNAGGTVNSRTAILTVTNAPVLSGANDLPAINEDEFNNNGTLVSALIAGQVSDPDPGALQGIAVTAVNNSSGTWQYSTNGGAVWSAFGTPSTISARLLASNANTYVRFVPNTNWNGPVTNGLTFRAWDRTTGMAGGTADVTANGGTTAFSTSTANSSIAVNTVNDAPVANSQSVSAAEDTAKAITLVGADVDNDPLVFSIVNGPTNGVLIGFNATNGAVTYIPSTNFNGADSFRFRVNDGTTNSATATVTITVAPVNDAPVLSGADNLADINGDDVINSGTLVSNLITGKATDSDAGALQGIAVTTVLNTDGTWQYSINHGVTWSAFGTPTEAAARLLAANVNTYVRFVPNTNWIGTVMNGLAFHAWDQTSGAAGGTADVTTNGGTTAFSSDSASSSITVKPTINISVLQPTALGGEVRVNTTTAGDQYVYYWSIRTVSVAPDGSFVQAWIDKGAADGNKSGVFGQRFDTNGSKLLLP